MRSFAVTALLALVVRSRTTESTQSDAWEAQDRLVTRVVEREPHRIDMDSSMLGKVLEPLVPSCCTCHGCDGCQLVPDIAPAVLMAVPPRKLSERNQTLARQTFENKTWEAEECCHVCDVIHLRKVNETQAVVSAEQRLADIKRQQAEVLHKQLTEVDRIRKAVSEEGPKAHLLAELEGLQSGAEAERDNVTDLLGEIDRDLKRIRTANQTKDAAPAEDKAGAVPITAAAMNSLLVGARHWPPEDQRGAAGHWPPEDHPQDHRTAAAMVAGGVIFAILCIRQRRSGAFVAS
eukprot:gnl/TRDRNA2_/TRDRNA2_87074_c0_seq1.p1 gnl/TRDRNA2_/TRDRNA2_87074_c0~~gnl/TRDRNA2_/TRDRNA2_87074_c0_seq1.p1  ORF type:complete len:291 (+),score=55.47 gnl/TRDRNA2_/TRDRNA2_87074_c0_seq1:118-990(+)